MESKHVLADDLRFIQRVQFQQLHAKNQFQHVHCWCVLLGLRDLTDHLRYRLRVVLILAEEVLYHLAAQNLESSHFVFRHSALPAYHGDTHFSAGVPIR